MTKEKKVFILRIVLWSLFAGVIPVIFIGWRYDLFKKASNFKLSGWGLIAIIFIFAFLKVLVGYIRAGIKEYSMLKQVLNGIFKVLIPLGVLLLLCVGIRSNIEQFIQALSCAIICETIAIPLNPFPKWVYEKSKGRFENLLDYIVEKREEK